MLSVTRGRSAFAASSLLLLAGCQSQPMVGQGSVSSNASASKGIVYYLDGAGGGGLITNWGRHVAQGLKDANYPGTYVEYDWETGTGVVADQMSSDDYKRQKAAHVAQLIQQYAKQNLKAPITVMGLSAGTAVAVFVLEKLPPGMQVDTAVLLSGSIASDYDMTKALRHVKGNLYITTSSRDEILSIAVPMFGTADRQAGDVSVVGIDGCVLPPGASAETTALYQKIQYLPWKPQYGDDGDFGGHTDTTVPPFVRDYIAPLIMKGQQVGVRQ
jgi:pimeloyl-ACP methyl ester carboxylesterase